MTYERSTVAVLPQLGVQSEQAPKRSVDRADLSSAGLERLADLSDGRHNVRPDAVHDEVGVSLQ